jgi:hypothetical protein
MKNIISILILSIAFSVNAQINVLTSLTKTGYLDQNGTFKSVSSGSLFICTENISAVVPSGSGSYIYLKTPQKEAGNITVTGYSVSSTPSQIYTLANATVSTGAFGNGTEAAPSVAWASEAASGQYRIGANNYGYSVNGTKVWEIAASGVSMYGTTTMTTATTGTLTTTGTYLTAGTPQTLTGAGAVNLTTYTTLLVTTGANALTLAAGAEGQHKFIRMKTDAGDGTLTVTNLQGGTTLTFNDAGDFVELYYVDAKWHIIVNSGATLA